MGVTANVAVWEAETEGIDLLHATIGDLLDQQAEAIPDREAIVYSYPEIGLDVRLTYRQLREEVQRVAKGLIALGIQPGEHVAVWAPNVLEWILLDYALAKIGSVLVTVNTSYRPAELDYLLRQGDVVALFLVAEFRDNPFLASVGGLVPELERISDPLRERIAADRFPKLRHVSLIGPGDRPGVSRFADVVALGEGVSDDAVRERQAAVKPHDVCQIQYTSGTTGHPKGAMLTHFNIVNNVRLINARAELTDRERLVMAMPFFHTSGCVMGILATLVSGGTLIPLIWFDPVKKLELCVTERATYTGCVPTMFIAMLHHPRAGEFAVTTLKRASSGGSPVPSVLMEQVKEKLGCDVTIVFGQTETSPVITQTVNSDSFELKSATVGIPLPHTEVMIVDPTTGEPVGLGESGELLARGYLVMRGYYNLPEKTAETIDADGWIHTGDLATMDERGYVNIVGRVKDMIIRGGENLYPAEIEAFLMRHPKVAEAQVVGVPDAFMQEEAVGVLRLKAGMEATEEEIREFCRANFSRNKIPKYFRFVTEYPLTANGKVRKFELRERLIRELGLEDLTTVKTA